jgi:alpha-beta hydrolase superfamily lysophospholipase
MNKIVNKQLSSSQAEYSEHQLSSAGTSIVLSVWAVTQPEAVIVFIPATMVHPLFYEPLLEEFAKSGFTVVGLHPVGHGKSPRNRKRYTISDIVQNGCDAVSFALERYGLPVIVAGSSQGGIVAAAVASQDKRVAAVFPHNVMLPELPDTIGISRFPKWLRHIYHPLLNSFRLFARLFPDLQLPLSFYLERKRISADPAIWDKVEQDTLCLKQYPLCFLASLFTTRFPGLTDGSIHCPIYVVADTGDTLFTEAYTQKVFAQLRAPQKEMVVFDFNDHMLMVTHPQEVCAKLTDKMRTFLRQNR